MYHSRQSICQVLLDWPMRSKRSRTYFLFNIDFKMLLLIKHVYKDDRSLFILNFKSQICVVSAILYAEVLCDSSHSMCYVVL